MSAVSCLQEPVERPHATAAASALRISLAASYGPVRAAIEGCRAAHASLRTADDLVAVLQAAGASILASEALAAAGKSLEAAARAAMAQTMSETGCPAVALDHHTVHLGTKPDRVDIEDESAIPPDLMRQPAPDRVAIGRLLRAGAEVPGARLVGNQEPVCVFRSYP